jgi:hypothetical protein
VLEGALHFSEGKAPKQRVDFTTSRQLFALLRTSFLNNPAGGNWDDIQQRVFNAIQMDRGAKPDRKTTFTKHVERKRAAAKGEPPMKLRVPVEVVEMTARESESESESESEEKNTKHAMMKRGQIKAEVASSRIRSVIADRVGGLKRNRVAQPLDADKPVAKRRP